MQNYKHDFIEFAVGCNVLQFGEFVLKSGRHSPYFFNAGLFNNGNSLTKLGQFYAHTIKDSALEFDILYGPAYKGIPLAVTTAIALAQHHDINSPYCFNRKEVKDHGEGGLLVGAELKGGKALIVDDVITAGTAIGESAAILDKSMATMAGVIIALDRQEKGPNGVSAIKEVETKHKTQVVSIVKFEDILAYLQLSPNAELSEYTQSMQQYRDSYGI